METSKQGLSNKSNKVAVKTHKCPLGLKENNA